MKSVPATGRVRCAIYTRVSTDQGLDQDFNSLDAQYEAASAYIKSQAHAGWTLVRSRYDDGGYSGGSTDRPNLQRLLDDVRSRKVDVIVVYKVDRLTRRERGQKLRPLLFVWRAASSPRIRDAQVGGHPQVPSAPRKPESMAREFQYASRQRNSISRRRCATEARRPTGKKFKLGPDERSQPDCETVHPRCVAKAGQGKQQLQSADCLSALETGLAAAI